MTVSTFQVYSIFGITWWLSVISHRLPETQVCCCFLFQFRASHVRRHWLQSIVFGVSAGFGRRSNTPRRVGCRDQRPLPSIKCFQLWFVPGHYTPFGLFHQQRQPACKLMQAASLTTMKRSRCCHFPQPCPVRVPCLGRSVSLLLMAPAAARGKSPSLWSLRRSQS